jgi:hypothetical protein
VRVNCRSKAEWQDQPKISPKAEIGISDLGDKKRGAARNETKDQRGQDSFVEVRGRKCIFPPPAPYGALRNSRGRGYFYQGVPDFLIQEKGIDREDERAERLRRGGPAK